MKNKNIFFLYYGILFVLLLTTWARQELMPMPIRVAYLLLVFAPVVNRVWWFFPCLVLFLTTSLLSFAGCTFMPTEIIIYVLITAAFALMSYSSRKSNDFPIHIFLLILFITIIVNLLASAQIEKVSYSFLILTLLPLTIKEKNRDEIVDIIPKLFVIATTSCAILTLMNQQLLIIETYDYERLISGSLNYTCCTLGIGFILALREYLKSTSQRIPKLLYAFSMMILLITIVMEASRGAMFGIAVTSVLYVLNRQSRLRTKIIVITLSVLFLILLYNNHVLDMLIYRIQNDTGTGTGRTEIWSDKFNVFLNSISVISAIFGIGFERTWNLGGGGATFVGCHNDFLAFFIEYGIIGLSLFLALLIIPFRVAKSRMVRHEILPLVAYIVTTCMTLEPFSMGYLPFCFFLFYIYLRSYRKSN